MGIGTGAESTHAPSRIEIDLGTARVPIDAVSLEDAVSWVIQSPRSDWQVLVTPNLHHLRIVRRSSRLAERYAAAALSLPDGWPVAWLATRVSGRRVERVTGADLFQTLIERDGEGIPLVLVGGTPGAELDDLFGRLRRLGWQLWTESAPRTELDDPHLRSDLVARIADAGCGGVVVIGVGTPRQEELASEIAVLQGRGAILCLGMSINFSSGAARRAPNAVRFLHLEWLYRASTEPRRLLMRYVKDSLILQSLIRLNPRRRLP